MKLEDKVEGMKHIDIPAQELKSEKTFFFFFLFS